MKILGSGHKETAFQRSGISISEAVKLFLPLVLKMPAVRGKSRSC
jgi:hypothetical protein